VNKRYLALSGVAIVTAVAILFSSCRKINESTELGGGLIPPVDNIHTFDTTVEVQAFNDTFSLATDSQYLGRNEVFYLGKINNDPLFGKTDAQMFIELKPLVYGAYPFARKDSVKIDSIVLVLSYLETYGDSTIPQTMNVYELDHSNNFRSDSLYLVRKSNLTYNTALPLSFPVNQQILPKNLDDTVKAFRDTTTRQLRIKLDTNFARRLFNYDTSNAYKTDSIFNDRFKGFAIRSENSGNAVMGFNLADVNTKLAIYYKFAKPNSGGTDSTTVNYFFFSALSAGANQVQRDYTGYPVAAAAGGPLPDQLVYLQNSPGTFATLKIPALSTIGNRVIHLAELVMEQVYDVSDTMFGAPEFLYLDANDPTITSSKKFRSIPYDVIYDNFGSPQNLNGFGIVPATKPDGSGHTIKYWKFNISRYVQHVLTGTAANFDLRLYAPFTVSNKFLWPRPDANDLSTNFNINPTIAKGRVRLGGTNHPTQKMKLRIVYSKL
jgi:Domain of unknown function (DUF4270)